MLYSYEKFLSELGAKVRSMRKERGWTFRHMIVAHGYHLAHGKVSKRDAEYRSLPCFAWRRFSRYHLRS